MIKITARPAEWIHPFGRGILEYWNVVAKACQNNPGGSAPNRSDWHFFGGIGSHSGLESGNISIIQRPIQSHFVRWCVFRLI